MEHKIVDVRAQIDAGKTAFEAVKAKHALVASLRERLDRQEDELAALEAERAEMRTECGFCEDCTACIG